MLRSRDEDQGSETASLVGLTRADWLFEHGRVRTLDPRWPVAEAIAVGGGRVLGIGSRTALAAVVGPRTERIDCRGATVLPGLIDPHLHLFALAARHTHVSCGEMQSIAELLAAVRARAATLPAGVWVRGDGLDEMRLGRLPTAAELDAAAPRHPVRLRHRSLHASVLNGRALALAGQHGRGATGLVAGRESALTRVVGRLPPAQLAAGLVRAGRELAALGLCTVAEASPRSRRDLVPLEALMAAGDVGLRVYAMRPPGSRPWAPRGRLASGAVKVLVEESGARLRPDPAALARRIARAAAAGAQVAVHTVGVATLVAALAAFAALPRARRVGRRHRLEHVAECPPALIARIAALGLTVVTNPAFVFWRGDVYRHETAAGARGALYRARSLAAAGVPLAGASDAPVVSASPWVGIAAARSRRTRTGQPLGVVERLDADAALRLFTTGAARALGADHLGRLVPGGPADLVVVEPDPLRAGPDEVRTTRVRYALVDGRCTWPA